MVIEYIFIQKDETPIEEREGKYGLFPKFCLFLEKVFINLTKDTFDVVYKKRNYTINYKCIKCRSGEQSEYPMCYFTISIDLKVKARCSEVLDFANQIILQHENKETYTVIISYDGVSKYYCDRAYPKFNEFERKIRSLIFRLLTKDFGEQWLNETTTVEQRSVLKERLQSKPKRLKEQKLIEEAPYAMDIYQLEEFLFAPTRHMPIVKLLDEQFSDEKLNKLTKEELLLILDNLKPRSVWEKCFKEQVSIENLQQKLNDLRLLRNMVAHSKFFYKKEFDQSVKLIDDLLQQIEVAITDVSINEYEPLTLKEKIFGLSSVLTDVSLNFAGVGLMSDWLADYGTEITKMQDMIAGAFTTRLTDVSLNVAGTGLMMTDWLTDYGTEITKMHDMMAGAFTTPFSNIVSQFNGLGKGLETLAITSNKKAGIQVPEHIKESMSLVSQIQSTQKLVNQVMPETTIEMMSNHAARKLIDNPLLDTIEHWPNTAYGNKIYAEIENDDDTKE